MPQLPGFERPYYNLEQYLLVLAKDVAELVVDSVKMERFREQLKIYTDLWKQWKIAEEADQKGCWTPQMGRPEYIFNIFSRSYNPWKEPQKEVKRLAGSYALCALIHDSQLSHLEKINNNIIPKEAIEETLSAPDNMLEDSIVGRRNASVYVIEVFYNYVKVDLQEFCNLEKNKSRQASIEKQIQQASKLSDMEFLELTAKKFEERAKKVLPIDETWHDINRSLRGWFDVAIERLKKQEFSEDEIGLLNYYYKNLLHFTEGINTRSFRGFPDSSIITSAREYANKLSEKFKELAQRSIISKKDKEKKIQGSFNVHQDVDGKVFVVEGECHILELKETLEYDINEKRQNATLRKEALQAIAAFLNTDGGTLLIGVANDGEIKGLKEDFKLVKDKNQDGFEQKLRGFIREKFNPIPFGNIHIAFPQLKGITICQVNVEQYPEVVDYDNDIYIRDGNGKRKLEGRNLVNWMKQRLGNKA